ncbi:hypothetical protein GCM10007368_18280 [Isoptericola cucumis]|uniref:Uncharacterized protein n=1 Tax=Isoptericola cucumis TaxID=1776856 RepID=A0ABQ2B4W6_9MICO|nr:hypothetical protein GCM10007368_18280 [Isoptericola cucumis]
MPQTADVTLRVDEVREAGALEPVGDPVAGQRGRRLAVPVRRPVHVTQQEPLDPLAQLVVTQFVRAAITG